MISVFRDIAIHIKLISFEFFNMSLSLQKLHLPYLIYSALNFSSNNQRHTVGFCECSDAWHSFSSIISNGVVVSLLPQNGF